MRIARLALSIWLLYAVGAGLGSACAAEAHFPLVNSPRVEIIDGSRPHVVGHPYCGDAALCDDWREWRTSEGLPRVLVLAESLLARVSDYDLPAETAARVRAAALSDVLGKFDDVVHDYMDRHPQRIGTPHSDGRVRIEPMVLFDANLAALRVGVEFAIWPEGRLTSKRPELVRRCWYVIPAPGPTTRREPAGYAELWESVDRVALAAMIGTGLDEALRMMAVMLRSPPGKSLGKRFYPEPSGAKRMRLDVIHREPGREWIRRAPIWNPLFPTVEPPDIYSLPVGWKVRIGQ